MTAREKYLEDNTKAMVDEITRFLQSQEKSQGRLMSKELAINFLAGFIGAQVYAALRDRPSHIKSNKAMLDYALKNFTALKTEIQDSVAAGFQGGLQSFTGKHCEYYCQIKTIPEAVNKQPC